MASWNERPVSNVRNIKRVTWAIVIVIDLILWFVLINAAQGFWRLLQHIFGG